MSKMSETKVRRPKGLGGIRQRSEGSWQIRYDGPPDGRGKRKQVQETIRGTLADAHKLLRKRQAEVESRQYVPKILETMAMFMESWVTTYATTHTSPRTLMGYKGIIICYIIPYLGKVQVQSLTPRHVQNLHRWMLDKGLSNQSVVHSHRVLSEALKHAVSWGIIPKNPAESVSPPRPEPKELNVWDTDTIKQFIEASEGSPFHEAFVLALHTGMRRSEITGLRWEGVDFTTNQLRVTGTLQRVTGYGLLGGLPKTRSSRRAIALGKTAINLLHTLRGKQLALQAELGDLYLNEGGYVFANELGKPIDSNRLSQEFTRIVKTAHLPHATFHSLRHCHASLMLADGASIKVISERLGDSHASLTLDIHSHLLPGIQEQAAEALDRRLARG